MDGKQPRSPLARCRDPAYVPIIMYDTSWRNVSPLPSGSGTECA
jgi:hypothetical protein